jgi:hypothetical protein
MSRDYGDYLIDMLAPWAPVSARRMFGGLAWSSHQLYFRSLAQVVIHNL